MATRKSVFFVYENTDELTAFVPYLRDEGFFYIQKADDPDTLEIAEWILMQRSEEKNGKFKTVHTGTGNCKR